MTASTSDRVSSLAARYVKIQAYELQVITSTKDQREQTAGEIRTMAASLLRQDEERGLRKLWRKVTGRV